MAGHSHRTKLRFTGDSAASLTFQNKHVVEKGAVIEADSQDVEALLSTGLFEKVSSKPNLAELEAETHKKLKAGASAKDIIPELQKAQEKPPKEKNKS